MHASIDYLRDRESSDLNNKTRSLTFSVAVNIIFFKELGLNLRWNASLRCSYNCSSDITVILPRTLRSCVNCSVSHLLWSNSTFC